MNIFTVSSKASMLYGYDMDAAGYAALADFYKKQLVSFLAAGETVRAYNGGMLGADMVFARVCADLRDAGADISCVMYVPYINHDELWDAGSKRLFQSIASRMDEVRLNRERFTKLSFLTRNNWFIGHCQVCLAVTGKEARGEVLRVMDECVRKKLRVIHFADGRVSPYRSVKRLFVSG